MMERVINTMFHGSLRARIYLWSVFVMGIAAIALMVLAVSIGAPAFGVGAVGCAVAGAVLANSVSLEVVKGNKRNDKIQERSVGNKKNTALESESEMSDTEYDNMSPHEKVNAKARYIAGMNDKKMKQLLKRYKVRQEHVFVMIDSYPDQKISQAPAVMWRTDSKLCFLALEGRACEFSVGLNEIQGIYYQKNEPADPEEEYPSFRYASFISKLYGKYLPEYRERNREGNLEFTKNLFWIKPGIYFTNTSMGNLMKVLPKVPFLVDDEVNQSTHFDVYFKELYRSSILCQNNVINLEEHRDKVENTMESLLDAPMSGRDFVKSLRDMSRYHLINKDHVSKYSNIYRQKNKLQ